MDFEYHRIQGLTSADRGRRTSQNLRKALIRGLQEHIRFEQKYRSARHASTGPFPLPFGMARELMSALEQVNAGESAMLFSPLRVRGGRGNQRSIAKQTAVDLAVRYLTAVELDWVVQKAAAARVAQLYGVSARQVQRWVKAAGRLAQREQALVAWASSAGFRSPVSVPVGRGLARLLPAMAKRYRT